MECGTNILEKPKWSCKTFLLSLSGFFGRRPWPGLAGVVKQNPPQRPTTEIVSTPPHVTTMEWCLEALCKCVWMLVTFS